MKTFQIVTDQHGRIRGQGIHDATVHSFRFVCDERFDVCLRGLDGQDRWIHLLDIRNIGFKDVVNGLIVSDVFAWAIKDLSEANVGVRDAWRVLLGGNYREEDLHGAITRTKVRYASFFLVFFESSYGGSIAAISREIQADEFLDQRGASA
jgi:hypothetical protein